MVNMCTDCAGKMIKRYALVSPFGRCCAQRIIISMIASGNHTEISGARRADRALSVSFAASSPRGRAKPTGAIVNKP